MDIRSGIALFAGAGGLELGIDIAVPGFRTVAYVERESYSAATLVARMAEQTLDQAPIWDDVTTFDPAPWAGKVDIITAGFPCQPFSAAGSQRGQADSRWLWHSIERIIREVRPGWVFLENVPGLVRLGLGPVLSGLAQLGYDAEWGLFSASEAGAPHKRERWFCLAKRRDSVDDSNGPRPTRDDQEIRAGRHTADDAGGQLADPDSGQRSAGTGSNAPWNDGRDHATGGGVELADPGRELLEGRRGGPDGQEREDKEWSGWSTGQPIFPPGPADLDLWARLLAEAPEAEPSLCRDADGVAEWMEYRQDRLRTLGNGVVPLEAAYALCTLADRAGWLV